MHIVAPASLLQLYHTPIPAVMPDDFPHIHEMNRDPGENTNDYP
jgi:hypothetical protein